MQVTDIDATEAVRLIGEGALLLDVREDDEWAAGHAPMARHLPMNALPDRAGELDPSVPVVCVCRLGGRSAAVAAALVGAGFDVTNLAGGMVAWEAAGFDVVGADGAPGTII